MSSAHIDHTLLALADPTRRAILKLRNGTCTTTDVGHAYLHLSRYAVMKHLDMLRNAELIQTRKSRRERMHSLNVGPIRQVYQSWLQPFMSFDKQVYLEGTEARSKVRPRSQLILLALYKALGAKNLSVVALSQDLVVYGLYVRKVFLMPGIVGWVEKYSVVEKRTLRTSCLIKSCNEFYMIVIMYDLPAWTGKANRGLRTSRAWAYKTKGVGICSIWHYCTQRLLLPLQRWRRLVGAGALGHICSIDDPIRHALQIEHF